MSLSTVGDGVGGGVNRVTNIIVEGQDSVVKFAGFSFGFVVVYF